MNNNIAIVMYHYVRDLKNSRYPNIKGLDYNLFKEQIKFLKSNFNIVRMEEVIASVYEGYKLPENPALLTFDDGYIDHFTNVFPILKEQKIQGSFFIPSRTFTEHKLLDVNKIHFILASSDEKIICKEIFRLLDYYRGKEYNIESNEFLFNKLAKKSRFDTEEVIFIKRLLQSELDENLRNDITDSLFKQFVNLPEDVFAKELYLNYDQIKCMKECGMFIGTHGYNHEWLGKIDTEKMKKDIQRGISDLSGIIDKDNMVMNYPYGSYSDEVVGYTRSMNFKLGLTTDVEIANLHKDNPLLLPRMDTNDFPPKSSNFKKYI